MTQNDHSAPRLQAPRRIAPRMAAAADAVILADCSDSMNDRDGRAGERMPLRRIDRLAKVLGYLLTRVRVRALLCFADLPVEIPLAGRVVLPEPSGSTNLAAALEHVAGLLPAPRRCIVISDGMPNNVTLALTAARRLRPMVLDAYYVGPDGVDYALAFMRDLSACGGPGGRSGHFDMLDPALLGSELQRRLLAGPAA